MVTGFFYKYAIEYKMPISQMPLFHMFFIIIMFWFEAVLNRFFIKVYTHKQYVNVLYKD